MRHINAIVYDSGTGGMFLGCKLSGSKDYELTLSNEYLSTSHSDWVYSKGDPKINTRNGITTTHPHELYSFKRKVKKEKATATTIGITFDPDDTSAKIYAAILFEIKHRIHSSIESPVGEDWLDNLVESINCHWRTFMNNTDIINLGGGVKEASYDKTIDFRKLYIDADIQEIVKLITYTQSTVDSEWMKQEIITYTNNNMKLIDKWAPAFKGHVTNDK